MIALAFTVDGIPAPQGSKNQFGGEANPRTRPWRAAVAAEAARATGSQPLLDGPLAITVTFTFPRPKAHYRKAGLKPDAPIYHATRPDTDKLVRAIGNALTGVAIRDDSQLAVVRACKVYGEHACAEVLVDRVPDVSVDRPADTRENNHNGERIAVPAPLPCLRCDAAARL